jgi:DNA-binding MarR family transcriptional regulator
MELLLESHHEQIEMVADGLRRSLSVLETLSISSEAPIRAPNRSVGSRAIYGIDTLALAERLIFERRNREKFFEASSFGEPVWDILLDLFVAGKRGREISVSSACIGACVPPTTALRHLVMLTETGKIVRCRDEQDSRRVYVELAPETSDKMEAYLIEMATTLPTNEI